MARHHRHPAILPSIPTRLTSLQSNPWTVVLLGSLMMAGAMLTVAPGAAAEPGDFAPPEQPRLLEDLRVTPRSDGSDPGFLRRLEGLRRSDDTELPFYFGATDDPHGRELWRLTPDGAPQRLTDVCPGPCDSIESYAYAATLDDGRTIFAAEDGENGQHLWITDGTEQGTRRLTPNLPSPSVEAIGPLPLDGLVYFSFRLRLWRTDGTPEGTEPYETDPDSMPWKPRDLIRVGDRIVFWSYLNDDYGLWSIDGVTPTVTALAPGSPDSFYGPAAVLLRSRATETLVFDLHAPGAGHVLMATGGTPGTTYQLTTLCADFSCFYPRVPLTLVGDHAVFSARGDQVWRTDGTVAGTERVATLAGITWVQALYPGPDSILATSYYSGTEKLWRLPTDGALPTQPIEVVEVGNSADYGAAILPAGPVLFRHRDDRGDEVWVSDGTPAGTRRLADLAMGAESSKPDQFVSRNGSVLFAADDERIGRELYSSDGTEAGTARIADLRGTPDGSRPEEFVESAGRVFFTADVTDPPQFRPSFAGFGYLPAGDLFVTNGQQTVGLLEGSRANDLTPLGKTSSPGSPFDDKVFFVAGNLPPETYDNLPDYEPWITDGTVAGTFLLAEIEPGTHPSYPRDAVTLPTPDGERILFFADRGLGAKLWLSDGTPGGTELLTDIYPTWDNVHLDESCTAICSPPYPPTRIYPRDARRLGDRVVFIGRDPSVGEELWITDGTATGTRHLVDLIPGGTSSYPEGLVVAGDALFFTAGPSPNDSDELVLRDLYVTNDAGDVALLAEGLGQMLGMVPLTSDAFATNAGTGPGRGVALLTRNDLDLGQTGTSLWVSDGTPGGTRRVAWFEPTHSDPTALDMDDTQLTAADGLVYFTLQTEAEGTELWRSDGTEAGTFMVEDLYPGARGSMPTILDTRGRQVVFGATDGSDDSGGTDLWISDGEPGDARNLSQIGPALQAPTAATFTFDGRLFVAADDGARGSEPWIFGGSAVPPLCEPDPLTLCLSDRFRIQVTWGVPSTGATGPGRTLPGTEDTGFFWFFGPDNVELAVKVLDGTSINGHHWLFYGALSDVEYTIVAEDLLTGRVRAYTNPSGNLCGGADVEAFREPNFLQEATLTPPQVADEGIENHGVSRGADVGRKHAPHGNAAAEAARMLKATGTCGDDPSTLCLQDRFEVGVVWQTEDAAGNAQAMPFSHQTGMFWFFDDDNVELLVKVLDGRPVNDRFWVFYGALSDVEYTIRVVDTMTGAERTYGNARGNLCGGADVDAFGG